MTYQLSEADLKITNMAFEEIKNYNPTGADDFTPCITAPAPQQDHPTEAEIFHICTRAGVCCIGIQRGFGIAPDFVLFQPTVTLSGSTRQILKS